MKSRIHFRLYNLNRKYNPQEALKYLQEELALQEITKNTYRLAIANSQIGWCYIAEIEQPEKAKPYLETSLKLAREIKDSVRIGASLTFLGFMNQRESHYKTAMDYYFKSLKYKTLINQPNRLGFTYNLIGETYNLQEQYDKSLEFHFKALNERKKIPHGHIAHSYQNIGMVYLNIEQYDEAINYYQKALEIRLQQKNKKHIAMCYNGLGNANLKLGTIKTAIPFFEKSVLITDSLKAPYIQSIALIGLAKSYLGTNDLITTKQYVTQILFLANKHKYRDHRKDDYKILSDIYLTNGDHKNGFFYYQKYVSLKDSLINSKTFTQIAELEGIYNTEKKEQEIISLKQQQLLFKQKQRYKTFATYAIITVIVLLLGFLWYRNFKRKSIYRQGLEIKEQENEITRLKLESEEVKNKHYVVELNQFMQLMISKNNQIKDLQHELDNIPFKDEQEKEAIEKIIQLHNSRILTDEDWKSFRLIFEQIHPHFIKNL
ncbi:MAG: tetratricopeptide repeat protein, partial [Flavobacteriaceae bacterium]|nr:tetratricopeptide repeat protein [Flavobacteriaceae bacterium]